MADWLRHITLNAQAKTGFGPQLIVWFLIALTSLGLGLVFLCVAAFVWLAHRYDGVTAGLVLAGFFLIVAIIAAFAGLLARRRNRERARLELAARSRAASWLDPKLLAVGLEIGRTIGWRRIVTLAAAALVAAGVAKEWSGDKAPKDGAG
ncbi:MAG TPA: phage holin family protein [Xanthobacteraceae bacterium]|jgi:hypothetical protein